MPSRAETIALAREIVEKYKDQEPETPPTELLLAQGVLVMYGEIIRGKYPRNIQSRYFPENDSLDWAKIEW